MRIIGGHLRSRRLEAPSSRFTRPMPDRVREAVFDILASRYSTAGVLPPLHVVDLFAGSGSLGLEAISRGVADVLFVERRSAAATTLRRNIADLAVGQAAVILIADAWTAPLTTPQPDPRFDLIFLDPPYADARSTAPTGKLPRLMEDLRRAGWASDQAIAVVHHEASVCHDGGSAWDVVDSRRYGSSGITFLAPRIAKAAPPQASPTCRDSDEE